jgi:hypothetical protein
MSYRNLAKTLLNEVSQVGLGMEEMNEFIYELETLVKWKYAYDEGSRERRLLELVDSWRGDIDYRKKNQLSDVPAFYEESIKDYLEILVEITKPLAEMDLYELINKICMHIISYPGLSPSNHMFEFEAVIPALIIKLNLANQNELAVEIKTKYESILTQDAQDGARTESWSSVAFYAAQRRRKFCDWLLPKLHQFNINS